MQKCGRERASCGGTAGRHCSSKKKAGREEAECSRKRSEISAQNQVILEIWVPGFMVLCLMCVCSHGRWSTRAKKQPAVARSHQKSVCRLTSVSHSDINPWRVSCSQRLLQHRAWPIQCNKHGWTPRAVFPGASQQFNLLEKTEGIAANEGEQTQEKQFVMVKIQNSSWRCFMFWSEILKCSRDVNENTVYLC